MVIEGRNGQFVFRHRPSLLQGSSWPLDCVYTRRFLKMTTINQMTHIKCRRSGTSGKTTIQQNLKTARILDTPYQPSTLQLGTLVIRHIII